MDAFFFKTVLPLLGQTAIQAALLAVLGFLCRNWLAHKIKAQVDIQVAKEVENHKADLERDKQAYIHSLQEGLEGRKQKIMEQMKEFEYGIELRRNLALKFADKKLEGYLAIYKSCDELLSAFANYCHTTTGPFPDKNIYKKYWELYFRLAEQSSKLLREYSFYIPPEMAVLIHEIKNETTAALGAFMDVPGTMPEEEVKHYMQRWATVVSKMRADYVEHVYPAQQ